MPNKIWNKSLTNLEKIFINREKKARGNIKKLKKQLQELDLPDALSILEIGCGIGSVSAYLADYYSAKVWGTDFDSDEIEIARKLYSENDQLKFQVEDASSLSFRNEQFDIVVSQNVFHHIPMWDKAIYEISRVLKITEEKLLDAKQSGAECVCVACPFCQLQFDRIQRILLSKRDGKHQIPSIIFTQLLGLGLGIDAKILGIHKNEVDMSGILRSIS